MPRQSYCLHKLPSHFLYLSAGLAIDSLWSGTMRSRSLTLAWASRLAAAAAAMALLGEILRAWCELTMAWRCTSLSLTL